LLQFLKSEIISKIILAEKLFLEELKQYKPSKSKLFFEFNAAKN